MSVESEIKSANKIIQGYQDRITDAQQAIRTAQTEIGSEIQKNRTRLQVLSKDIDELTAQIREARASRTLNRSSVTRSSISELNRTLTSLESERNGLMRSNGRLDNQMRRKVNYQSDQIRDLTKKVNYHVGLVKRLSERIEPTTAPDPFTPTPTTH